MSINGCLGMYCYECRSKNVRLWMFVYERTSTNVCLQVYVWNVSLWMYLETWLISYQTLSWLRQLFLTTTLNTNWPKWHTYCKAQLPTLHQHQLNELREFQSYKKMACVNLLHTILEFSNTVIILSYSHFVLFSFLEPI